MSHRRNTRCAQAGGGNAGSTRGRDVRRYRSAGPRTAADLNHARLRLTEDHRLSVLGDRCRIHGRVRRCVGRPRVMPRAQTKGSMPRLQTKGAKAGKHAKRRMSRVLATLCCKVDRRCATVHHSAGGTPSDCPGSARVRAPGCELHSIWTFLST